MAVETPEAILIAAGFEIYTAPVGRRSRPMWTRLSTLRSREIGYTTEDGAVFTRTPSVTPINMHQSFEPVRYVPPASRPRWPSPRPVGRRHDPLAFGGGIGSTTRAGGGSTRPSRA